MVQVLESMDSIATMYSSSSIVQIVYLLTNPENRDAILKKSNVFVKQTFDRARMQPPMAVVAKRTEPMTLSLFPVFSS